jgi:NAD(P)-dependent dehydrogenase (short-subunit alcohol dehydrogenase family)
MPHERVLIVTGGGRGIGAEIVRNAVGKGYGVCFSYAGNREAAERLAAETGALAVQGDVADQAAVQHLFAQAEARLGPVTHLVNNAGITGRLGRFVDADAAMMRRVIDVNLLGTMLCAQEAVRRWTERGTAGCMVNLSSIAATLGAPGEYVHYAATKAAVEAFSIGLAKEAAASGTRVNVVSPGTVQTEIHAAAGDAGRPARVAQRVPMGRVGEPSEIAHAVLWLLSEEASFVTGAVLRVTGGI